MKRLDKLKSIAPKYRKAVVELGGGVSMDIEVKVLLKHEAEALDTLINNPSQERIDAAYGRISKPMRDVLEQSIDSETIQSLCEALKLEVTDSDIIIDGRSMRLAARFTATNEVRVEEYVNLIRGEVDDEPKSTFEELEAAIDTSTLKAFVVAVESVVYPDLAKKVKN